MKRSYSIILHTAAVLALASAAVWAEEVKVDNSVPGEGSAANCDLTGYKSEFQFPQAPVPDANAAGVTVGPIIVPADGSLIADVVIDLSMTHTWLGDLRVVVGYDELCDGAVDAQAVLLCRPRGTGTTLLTPCGGTATCCGCAADLTTASALMFDDSAAASLAEGTCVNPVPAGCYKPSIAGGTPLSVFRNLRKGGCWFMNVSDGAAGDTGTILSWSVHILNQTQIGVQQANWSSVKRLYN